MDGEGKKLPICTTIMHFQGSKQNSLNSIENNTEEEVLSVKENEREKLLDEKEKTLNEEITKRRQSFDERELYLNNTEQELLKRDTLLIKRDNDITAREVSHKISSRKTFWRPYIIGTSCFLAGGLLCYYGHSKIDAFVGYLSSFWRKN